MKIAKEFKSRKSAIRIDSNFNVTQWSEAAEIFARVSMDFVGVHLKNDENEYK